MEVFQNLHVPRFQCFIFLGEVIQDISYAQSCTACFLAICGADALSCGAHFVLAFSCFIGTVKHTVGGQDEVSTLADVKSALEVIAGRFQFVGFCRKQVGRYHASIANDIQFALVEDSRGNASQHEFLSFKDDSVSRIRTTCKACHYIIAWCEDIHYLSLALISEYDSQQGIYFSFSHGSAYLSVLLFFSVPYSTCGTVRGGRVQAVVLQKTCF